MLREAPPGTEEDDGPPSGLRVAAVVRWGLVALMAIAALGAWSFYARASSAVVYTSEQYQCPMHPSVLRDRPGGCPICGMDLVRVARAPEPHQAAATAVPGVVPLQIPSERTQLIGMKTAKATRQRLSPRVRAVGFVSADDSSISIVTTRYAGWVDQVRVIQGQEVRKGQVLATVSGPEILTAQQAFLSALEWAAKRKPAAGALPANVEEENNTLQRLGVAQQDIDDVARRKRPLPAMPIRAPISGHIARRNVLKGLYVQPGIELFQVVDLSKVWVIADVAEQDAGRLRRGQIAQLSLAAYPDQSFGGNLDFIYPALDLETHSVQARIQLPNPELKLRPGMYGDLLIDAPVAESITVPAEAVIDTGAQRYVFVASSDGRFEPRAVRLGERASGNVQVLEGLAEGESVVTTANFLVDSESRMRAAVEAFGQKP
jgi:membrane fusion protein, copper/silver efflux system